MAVQTWPALPVKDWLSAFKPRIVVMLVVVAVITAFAAAKGDVLWSNIGLLAASGALSSAGASLLNNYRDRDIDVVMERTKNRPLANGRINATSALIVGVSLLLVSAILALLLNYAVAVFVIAGAAVYVGIYSYWLKRRTSLNIVFGGLSGSFAVLAGWYTGASVLTLESLLIAAMLLLWTPYHFWSFALVHQDSYRKAKVPMLPLVVGEKKTTYYVLLHWLLLFATSVLLFFFSGMGTVYLAGALLCGVIFGALSVQLCLRYDRKKAWRHYKLSGVYLLGLFVAIALDVIIH